MSTHITTMKPLDADASTKPHQVDALASRSVSRSAVALPVAIFLSGTLLLSSSAARAQQTVAPVAPLDTPASPASRADDASALPGATVNVNNVVGNMAGTTGSDAALGGINFADAGLADARNRASESSTPLSLADAIYLTLQNNPQRDVAQAALAAARARIGAARSAGGLQVGLSGGVNANRSFGGTNTGGIFNTGTGIGTGGTTIGGTTTGGTTDGSGVGGNTGGNGGGTAGGTGTGGTGTTGTGTTGTGTTGTGTTGTGTTGTGTTGTGTTGTGTTTGGTSSGRDFLGFNPNESLGVSAGLPLLTGGRVKASTRAADFAARAQAAQTLQTEQDLVLSTITSYLSILRSDQLLQVAESNLSVSRERLRVANVRFEAGAAARLDVFRAQTTLADAIQRRITGSNALAQSKAALNTLIGRVPEAPLRVQSVSLLSPRLSLPTGVASGVSTPIAGANGAANFVSPAGSSSVVLADGSPVDAADTSGSGAAGATPVAAQPGAAQPGAAQPGATSAQLRAVAEQARPALAIGRNQIGAAEASIDVARSQRKPQLGLSLSGFLRNPATFAGRFALGLGLNVAQGLFDSGRSRSQIAEAQALAEQARQSLQVQRLNVANQIEQSLLAFDSARGRAQSSEIAVTAAQEAVRAAQLGYEAGVATNLEVSDAQTALLTTQTDAVNARFDVASSQAQVSAAVGVLTQEGQTALERAMNEETARAKAVEANAPKKKKRRKFLGIF